MIPMGISATLEMKFILKAYCTFKIISILLSAQISNLFPIFAPANTLQYIGIFISWWKVKLLIQMVSVYLLILFLIKKHCLTFSPIMNNRNFPETLQT